MQQHYFAIDIFLVLYDIVFLEPGEIPLKENDSSTNLANLKARVHIIGCISYLKFYRSVRKVVAKLKEILATNRNEVASNLGHYFSDPFQKRPISKNGPFQKMPISKNGLFQKFLGQFLK